MSQDQQSATVELLNDLKLWACSPRVPQAAQLVMLEAIGRLSVQSETGPKFTTIPDELFDGPSVYASLTDRELEYMMPKHVSTALDAVVRLMRKNRATQPSATLRTVPLVSDDQI